MPCSVDIEVADVAGNKVVADSDTVGMAEFADSLELEDAAADMDACLICHLIELATDAVGRGIHIAALEAFAEVKLRSV